MSHFTVMVQIPKEELKSGISVEEYVERVLEPYDENKRVEPRIDVTKEELIKEYHESMEEIKNDPDCYLGRIQRGIEEKQVDILSMTQEEFSRWYHGEHTLFDADGNILTTYNPKSEWDWWVIGGRWSNLLVKKNGEHSDFSLVKDLDIDGYIYARKNEKERYWAEAFTKYTDEGTRNFIYGIKPGMTKEEYVNSVEGISTFAIVNKNGEWIERGNMGWWGIVTSENESEEDWSKDFYSRFIEPLDPEDGIVIVDCHI